MNAMEVVGLSDEALAAAVDEGLARLTPRAQAHALAVAGGKTAAQAARELGMSQNGRVLARMKARTAPVLALLREQARRRAVVTVQGQIQRFQQLSRTAEEAGETSAAIAAEREVGRLANLYPDARLLVQHELLDTREVTAEEIEALSLLRHGVRRQLTGQVIEAEVTSIDGSPVTSAAQGIDITARALGADGKEGSDAP